MEMFIGYWAYFENKFGGHWTVEKITGNTIG